MPCAKFGVDWSRNVGGVGKNSFAVFAILRKKIIDANGRGLCQKMQLTPVNLWIERF